MSVFVDEVRDLSKLARGAKLGFRVARQRYDVRGGKRALGPYVALAMDSDTVVRELGDDPAEARGTVRMLAAAAKLRAKREAR